jgi:hypothetical protein
MKLLFQSQTRIKHANLCYSNPELSGSMIMILSPYPDENISYFPLGLLGFLQYFNKPEWLKDYHSQIILVHEKIMDQLAGYQINICQNIDKTFPLDSLFTRLAFEKDSIYVIGNYHQNDWEHLVCQPEIIDPRYDSEAANVIDNLRSSIWNTPLERIQNNMFHERLLTTDSFLALCYQMIPVQYACGSSQKYVSFNDIHLLSVDEFDWYLKINNFSNSDLILIYFVILLGNCNESIESNIIINNKRYSCAIPVLSHIDSGTIESRYEYLKCLMREKLEMISSYLLNEEKIYLEKAMMNLRHAPIFINANNHLMSPKPELSSSIVISRKAFENLADIFSSKIISLYGTNDFLLSLEDIAKEMIDNMLSYYFDQKVIGQITSIELLEFLESFFTEFPCDARINTWINDAICILIDSQYE